MITACLKASGISPHSIDRLTILVINGINSDVYSFNSKVAIGSNKQDLDGDFKTIFSSSYLSKPSDEAKLSLILSI